MTRVKRNKMAAAGPKLSGKSDVIWRKKDGQLAKIENSISDSTKIKFDSCM